MYSLVSHQGERVVIVYVIFELQNRTRYIVERRNVWGRLSKVQRSVCKVPSKRP